MLKSKKDIKKSEQLMLKYLLADETKLSELGIILINNFVYNIYYIKIIIDNIFCLDYKN